MRICYLGDAQSIHLRRWAGWFAARGHDVHVLTLRPHEIPGVEVHALPFDAWGAWAFPWKVAFVRRAVRQVSPDVLHAHQATGYGLWGALSGSHPFIVSAWGSDIAKEPRESYVARLIARFVLRRADLVHVGDEESRTTVARLGGDPQRCFVQAWGIDSDAFSPARRDAAWRSSVCPEGSVLFLADRNLEPHYKHEVLLRAVRELVTYRNQFRVVIAGAGSDEGRLRSRVSSWDLSAVVTFLGYVPPERMPTLYASSDAFVDCFASQVPGHGAGVSLAEAMACGIPPIVARRPGLDAFVVDGSSGFLVPPEDPPALAATMERLIRNRDLLRRASEGARRKVLEHADMSRNLTAFQAEMVRLLRVRGP